MTFLLNWVKQIFVICIFTGILLHLVPGEKYQQYIRFVCNIILTMVCIGPVITLLTGEEVASRYMQKLNSYIEQEARKNAIDIDLGKGDSDIKSMYETAVIEYVESRVLENGLVPQSTEVLIDWDEASEDYGTLQKIILNVADKNGLATDGKKFADLKSELAAYYGINEANVNIYGGR